MACTHCYADSGPEGTHGTMTTDDWRRVIGDVADPGRYLRHIVDP
ncbi:hypothetical protein Q8A49_07150 [Nocardiopsis umidischolae]|uniref:Uncharacterized protein n=1 Tax=Nocardiopsis tropica TaxID=109330 RepID=A0ABU7KLU9_9ACTN|nr:hypothetical protein [Nocardiopsis umidischolae]